ncbi:MAG: YeeE/YedE thiosulfate transporter family protein [Planctomycetota bacterium]
MSNAPLADQAKTASPLWNPYLAGVALGGVLLGSFLVLGAGLGASSAPARLGAWLESCVAPAHAAATSYFGPWLQSGSPLSYYLVYMFVGTFVGGLVSAVLAGRMRFTVERGPTFSALSRLGLALAGGVLAGYASRLAGGCTSGQALTGGSLLLNGSLVFMIAVFAGGYAAAYFVRRQWQ